MARSLVLIVGTIHLASLAIAQSFNPIAVSGFNHDVIAESPTASPLATTTTEMDAYDPSNFVLFTKAYAKARSIPANYGLPDNGRIASGDKIYQLAGYREKNALYLPKGTQGTLTFTPGNFDAISILGLATEGTASLQVFVTYDNGANRIFAESFHDWFDGPAPVIQGFGRVKREDGSTPYYEGGENPRMYSINLTITSDRPVRAVTIQNVSPGDNKASNRAVIFAVSVYKKEDPAQVQPKKKVVVRKKETEPKKTVVKRNPDPVVEQKPAEPVVVEQPKTVEPVVEKKIETPVIAEKIAPPPAPIEVGSVIVLKKVLFKQSTAELLAESFPQLDSIVDFLKANTPIHIEVAGHTDAYGSAKANLKLSNERAAEIKSYLVKSGVSSDRIMSKGYGGSKPVAPNTTEESRRLNRRVEFIILSK